MIDKLCYHLRETELVGTQATQDMLELVIGTAHVKREKTVSLVLLGEPESAKTAQMKKYVHNVGIYEMERFTAYGMLRDLSVGKITPLYPKCKIFGHILVPDFSALLSFKANTVESNIEFINAFTEEGLSKQTAYWIEIDGLKNFIGLKGGLITAITPFAFFTQNGKVKANLCKGGWLSRFIVFSYSISDVMKSRIFESILQGDYRRDKKFVSKIMLPLPKQRVSIDISDKYSRKIEEIAINVANRYSNRLPQKLTGFRLHKSLISLTEASALRDGRRSVEQRDVDRISYLSNWMNLDMNPLTLDYPFAGNKET